MSSTRRNFFEAAGTLAAGLAASASPAGAQPPAGSGQAGRGGRGAAQGAAAPGPPARPASELQIPKVDFLGAKISRIVLGINPFGGGGGHHPDNLAAFMRDWYTTERQVAVMHQCVRFGINAWNGAGAGSPNSPIETFKSEGGQFYAISQSGHVPDITDQLKNQKPWVLYNMGEVVDRAFQEDNMDEIQEWCKRARQKGVKFGIGTHKPEVIDFVESKGWDVDFYAGCAYNRTRTDDEWREVLKGELPEMSREVYVQSDPPRMYKVMKQTKKPCIAFKVLAAGRMLPQNVEKAYKLALDSLKPNDPIMVGFCPRVRDEVRITAEIVCKLSRAS